MTKDQEVQMLLAAIHKVSNILADKHLQMGADDEAMKYSRMAGAAFALLSLEQDKE